MNKKLIIAIIVFFLSSISLFVFAQPANDGIIGNGNGAIVDDENQDDNDQDENKDDEEEDEEEYVAPRIVRPNVQELEDNQIPIITLLGDATVYINQDEVYTDAGATAFDETDGDLTGDIVTVNPVDTTNPGTYTVTYNVDDAAGNSATEVTRTVIVVDTEAPTITVLGEDAIVMLYTEQRFTTYLNRHDTTDTYYIEYIPMTTGNVEINAYNTYLGATNDPYIYLYENGTYIAHNDDGGVGLESKMTVSLEAGHTYHLLVRNYSSTGAGIYDITFEELHSGNIVEVNTAYVDAGATALDNEDGDITSNIVTTNNVDETLLGVYTVDYYVEDSAGNPAEATRYVAVIDTTAPVITLNGDAEITIEQNDINSYIELGATATDNYDASVSVTVGGDTVDTTVLGDYVVTYDAVDSSMNNAVQITRTVHVVDTEAPRLRIFENGNYYEEDGALFNIVDLSAVINDRNVGKFYIDNVEYPQYEGATWFGLGWTLTEGEHTFKAVDTSGNTTELSFEIDLTKPVVRVLENHIDIASGDYVDRNEQVQVNAIDKNIGKVYINGVEYPQYEGDSWYDIDWILRNSTSETNTIILEDKAGNLSDPFDVMIDLTAPRLRIYSNGQYYEDNGHVFDTDNLSAVINDLHVGKFYINGIEYPQYEGATWFGLGWTLDEGSYTFRSVDQYGNATELSFEIVLSDTTAPTIELLGDQTMTLEALSDTYTEMQAEVVDDRDGTWYVNPVLINYRDVNGVFKGSVSNVDMSKPGQYKLVYRASDLAGNVAVDINRADHDYVMRIVYVVDTKAPTIELIGQASMTLDFGSIYTEMQAEVVDEVDGTWYVDPVLINYRDENGVFKGSVANIDTTKPGQYKLVYRASDLSGNAAVDINRADHDYVMRTVTVNEVPDTTAPVITLLGTTPINVPYGMPYIDAGATASDNEDGNITANIVTVNPVNTMVPGTYTVTYNVDDAAGNSATEVTRTVIVDEMPDILPPIILLNGDPIITLVQGMPYVEQGAIAIDNVDPFVPVLIGGDTVNTGMVGTYIVTYNAIDAAGNPAVQVTRTVNVVPVPDTQAPIITLLGTTPMEVEYMMPFVDPGVMITDNSGELILPVVGGDVVDTSVLGAHYFITYDAQDSSGNDAAQVTREVVIVATKPVITLNGDAVVTVENGNSYTDAGATATDYLGLTHSVTGTGTVDTTTAGVYTVTYNYTDSRGVIADTVTRTVIVGEAVIVDPTNTVMAIITKQSGNTNQVEIQVIDTEDPDYGATFGPATFGNNEDVDVLVGRLQVYIHIWGNTNYEITSIYDTVAGTYIYQK